MPRPPLLLLVKPGLSLMVALTATLGSLLARPGLPLALWVGLGTLLLSMAAGALNQVAEVEVDRRMERTRQRPLPAGAMSRAVAILVALLLTVGGLAVLLAWTRPLTAALGCLSLVIYVLVYTPLKRVTSLATLYGGLSGAIPPMMGWCAATGRLDPGAWILAGILFVWQIPHFMAVAWINREDLRRGRLRLLPAVDRSGRVTRIVILLHGLALVPVSLTALLANLGGYLYLFGSLTLGLWLAARCTVFFVLRTDLAARRLFRASLIYLPLLLGLMAWDPTTIEGEWSAPRARGDGTDPSTYGFALEPSLVPSQSITGSTRERDSIPVLDHPATLSPDELEIANAKSKYVVSGDLVIGVELGGEARAYPLRVLVWHEVVNDRLGGIPIAVVHAPLVGCSVVLDRRRSDQVMLLGHSGLLLDSGPLVYDRAEGLSLYSPILGRAVTGPRAGSEVTILHSAVLPWRRWLAMHPATTILARDPVYRRHYKRAPYSTYMAREKPRFPVSSPPPGDRLPPFTPLLIVSTSGTPRAYPHSLLETRARNGTWDTKQDGVSLRFTVEGGAAWVTSEPELPTLHCLWFAWYSLHPGEPGLVPDDQ